MRDKTRQLWDREFDIVKDGLDEAQVIAYIEELRKQHSRSPDYDTHIDSLKRLAERMVEEADRIAVEIKEEAGRAAKAKAVEIITQAENKLQEVIAAKGKAEAEAKARAMEIIAAAEHKRQVIEEEAQGIIQAASEEAAAIKDETRQKADQHLARLKEEAAETLRDDIRTIHQKLINALVNLAAEVRILESKWEVFGIEGIEVLPGISTLGAAKELKSPSKIQEDVKKVTGEATGTLTERPKGRLGLREKVQEESETPGELQEPPGVQEEVQEESEAAGELPEEVSLSSNSPKRRGIWGGLTAGLSQAGRFLRFRRSR